jgi:mannan endo-1,4-beta-mannosidase
MKKLLFNAFIFIYISVILQAQVKPVTPNASPEAIKLLEYLYSISGKSTLSGQHCAPLIGSDGLPMLEKSIGKYPALFGQDFGFSEAGTWDGINFRQRIVDEAIRRNNEGFVISIMWHAVRPIDDEPVEFKGGIMSKITDKEWEDMLTSGTKINEKWKSQVDVIAFYLKQLQRAKVPVLWRPYHEMNGDWFWWCNKPGENGYTKLYWMIYDRLVNFHGIKNLIWVFNANEIRDHVLSYKEFYPGNDVVDVLATDIYSKKFNQSDYDQLLELGGGKIIALGEVGTPPSVEILKKQPKWAWFMKWDTGIPWDSERQGIIDTYLSNEVITWDELPWVSVKKPVLHYPILK